jgi:protein-disulfide isomerase
VCKVLDGELSKLITSALYVPAALDQSPPGRGNGMGRAVPERAHDTAVLDRNLALAAQVGLRGTPLLIAQDGRLSEGAKPAAEVEAWLNAGKRQERPGKPSQPTETTR